MVKGKHHQGSHSHDETGHTNRSIVSEEPALVETISAPRVPYFDTQRLVRRFGLVRLLEHFQLNWQTKTIKFWILRCHIFVNFLRYQHRL